MTAPAAGSLDAVVEQAGELVDLAAAGRQRECAERLRDRLATGRFTIAVVGEFKRGKSTLVNALLGEAVVPMGVLPLTAVATELLDGDPAVDVVHLDGRITSVSRVELADYVTEAGNPDNVRAVDHVVVHGHWPLLAGGVTLQDTPGIGSVHGHNTAAARAAIVEADRAILVLSADTPIADDERAVLRVLTERRAPTFFVLNKADHLDPGELAQVREFVAGVIRAELGRDEPVFALSARAALAGGDPTGEWRALVAAVERFIERDLLSARLAGACRDLRAVADELAATLQFETAAADLDLAELAERVELFRHAASDQLRAFADECVLLERDVRALTDQLWQRLQAFAVTEPPRHDGEIDRVAATAPRRDLTAALRATVGAAVETSFERIRTDEQDQLERAWQTLADRLRDAAQRRVDGVREAASTLLAIPLPTVEVPALAEQRERFFYLFLHLDRIQPVATAASRLIPERTQRRRAAERARAELRAELSKHAGRARADLTSRLDATRLRFETGMRAELESTIEAIAEAAGRAERLRCAGEAERAARLADIEERLDRLAIIRAAIDDAGRGEARPEPVSR